jgi:hypothetical protein
MPRLARSAPPDGERRCLTCRRPFAVSAGERVTWLEAENTRLRQWLDAERARANQAQRAAELARDAAARAWQLGFWPGRRSAPRDER